VEGREWGEVGRVEGSGDDRESAKTVVYTHIHSPQLMYIHIVPVAVSGMYSS